MKVYLEAIIYFFSILGGVVSIITLYRWLAPYKKISWRKVEKGVVRLKDGLVNDNFVPSLIVGIGRGGSIVGALLSGCLGHVPLLVIDRAYKWENNSRKDQLLEQIIIHNNLEKVLLVAGELHTGGTARLYKAHFEKMGAEEIRFLTFAKDPYPAFKPDYYYVETKKADIRLPWMITRDYKRDSLKNAK